MKKEKNTRLIYNDEGHISMYEAMPPQQFKELMMAVLKYKYGDEGFADTIQDPMVRALFVKEKVDIDRNEEEWIRKKEIYKKNGSKGGRPPKVESEKTEFEEDVDKAKELYKKKDWWYDHHMNDMKNKYHIDYDELKSIVEDGVER